MPNVAEPSDIATRQGRLTSSGIGQTSDERGIVALSIRLSVFTTMKFVDTNPMSVSANRRHPH